MAVIAYVPIFALAFLYAVTGAAPVIEFSDTTARHALNEWSGTEALRNADYEDAIREILADTTFTDSGYHFFKLGTAYHKLEQYSKALCFLRLSAEKSPSLAPSAFERIADIELKQNRPENAISAYRTALEYPLPQRYEAYLHEKITRVILDNNIEPENLAWLGPWFETEKFAHEDTRRPLMDSLITYCRWKSVDSLTGIYLDSFGQDAGCGIFRSVYTSAIPDTVFTTQRLYQISRKAYACGDNQRASDWLHKALARNDFSRLIPEKSYFLYRGELNYRMGNYSNAIKWLAKYEKRFGPTPELVLTIARSYRNLGNGSKSAKWYDMHLSLYPSHARTHDILWFRAWQREIAGDLDGACRLYENLYNKYRLGPRADDALFRAGLCRYKQNNYSAAVQTWDQFKTRYPASPHTTAALFWRAKFLFSRNFPDSARLMFSQVASRAPLDYYAFRAREMLSLLSDTGGTLSLDSAYDFTRSRHWIDSIAAMESPALSLTDSTALKTGILLALSGFVHLAEFYLEPLEIRHTANLLLQFNLASLYDICGESTISYRIARTFAWRIPREAHHLIPLPVQNLLYPFSYSRIVNREAENFNVDPNLIYAVIRQESIFNPVIVSPAGAIGLMQIMPATGKEIAKSLDHPFRLDDLRVPEINIRFGAFYLRELLDSFDGNIVLALAGYNGGPHNAKKWYAANRHNEFDLFIENIEYTETRGYVKKVLANYWTYTLLERLNTNMGSNLLSMLP